MSADKAMIPLWAVSDLPFTIGAMPTAENTAGLPAVLPFTLAYDATKGLIRQVPDKRVLQYLEVAYNSGSLLGTAMDDTPLGRRYAEDFTGFIERNLADGIAGRKVLEIGAGRGYLLRCLQEKGADCIGIEPGVANAPHWQRHGVRVIADSYPSPQLTGSFDLILAYAVLEHIADPDDFLASVVGKLQPGGIIALSVPDCTPFIHAGDPSMLLHEHYLYFTAPSFARLLQNAGLQCLTVERAGYGGALYAIASFSGKSISYADAALRLDEKTTLLDYGIKCDRLVVEIRRRVALLASAGRSLGIYCPARGLAFLPQSASYRFFDDDPDLADRYYPPFHASIETRANLLAQPVDELWILSRTFGTRLRDALQQEAALADCTIRLLDELAPEVQP